MNRYQINVTDLLHNIKVLKKKAGDAEIIGVIKGNGYGFGLCYMASLLKTEGIRTFAVTELEDARKLREEVLFAEEILLLRSTCLPEEAEQIVRLDLTATIGSLQSIAVLEQAAQTQQKKVRAHLKIDTGMSRYGFTPMELDDAIAACNESGMIDFTGIYTHFSSAFTQVKRSKEQLQIFKNAVLKIEAAGINATMLHCANTPALFNVPGVTEGMTAVRIGSGFTGRVITKRANGLKRVGYVKSQVLEMKSVPKGTAIGYNGTYKAKKDSLIAIVPVGHTDGFGIGKAEDGNSFGILIHTILSAAKRFLLRDRMNVRINGKKYPTVGTIGLSHTAVDVTSSDVKPGDEVTFDYSPLLVNPLMQREYIETAVGEYRE